MEPDITLPAGGVNNAFSSLKEGVEVFVLNLGPDEPYKGAATPLPPADPKTTGQVIYVDSGYNIVGVPEELGEKE